MEKIKNLLAKLKLKKNTIPPATQSPGQGQPGQPPQGPPEDEDEEEVLIEMRPGMIRMHTINTIAKNLESLRVDYELGLKVLNDRYAKLREYFVRESKKIVETSLARFKEWADKTNPMLNYEEKPLPPKPPATLPLASQVQPVVQDEIAPVPIPIVLTDLTNTSNVTTDMTDSSEVTQSEPIPTQLVLVPTADLQPIPPEKPARKAARKAARKPSKPKPFAKPPAKPVEELKDEGDEDNEGDEYDADQSGADEEE